MEKHGFNKTKVMGLSSMGKNVYLQCTDNSSHEHQSGPKKKQTKEMYFSGHHNIKMNKMPPNPTPLRNSPTKPLESRTTTHKTF